MKRFRKLLSLVLTVIMVLAMSAPAFAQNVDRGQGTASITINNASKGETYSIYKLFDASVTGTDGGSIAYTGTIPEALDAYFDKVNGNIIATEAAGTADNMSEGLRNALKAWAARETATASAESDGSVLTFAGLGYGYYVVTTSQGEQAITVTSTNPNAQIYDKNESRPTFPEGGGKQIAGDTDVYIGETITYTITFDTTNFVGDGEEAEKVESYTIHDTLPNFLSNVSVTSITIDGQSYAPDGSTPQFANNEITIPWVDSSDNSLYENGAQIVITYTAVVTDNAVIDGAGNTNTVTITWTTEDGEIPEGDGLTDTETIYTYAIAIKKVDQDGKKLAGAQFSVAGIRVTGSEGNYVVTDHGSGLSTGNLECDVNGELVIEGVEPGDYVVTETVAPDGYNKLGGTVTVTAVKTGESTTSTTTYLDDEGNITSEVTETEVIYTLAQPFPPPAASVPPSSTQLASY